MLFLLLPLCPLAAQEGEATDEEEADSYLWSYQMGDSNVDFYWDGYWRFHFSSGLAFLADGDGIDWSSTYDDYTDGFRFLQTPDLLLSLWIDDRYFFEASVVEDYDKNTYLLGYQGQDGEYLQSVKLGNTSITTDSYAGLSVSSPLYNTPGITARGNTENMQNELMIRFDGTWEESKIYIGTYEADEEYLELYDYSRCRRFALPDASPENLRVYIRDDGGSYSASTSSYTYRLAEEGDYLLDSDGGILTLEEEVTGPVAVYYTIGGSDVGDSTAADAVVPPTDYPANTSGIPDVNGSLLPFDWAEDDPYDTAGGTYAQSRLETIGSYDCLLIYEPDRFSPFAVYADYPYSRTLSSDSWRNSLHVVERYGTDRDDPDNFDWEADSSEKTVTLYRTGSDSRDALSRYPLGDVLPELYGNAPLNRTELVPWQLRLITKTSSSGFRLGTGVVPGSVSITVNGSPEYNYDLDSDTGTITFNRYIFPDDRIEISYRRETLNFEGQEMLIYQGNRFRLSERDTLEVAESFNWVFPDGTDNSTEDGGTVQLSTLWKHKGESLNFEAELTGEADLGDADGIERIMGMEDALSSYPFYEEALAQPKAGESETDNDFSSSTYVAMNGSSGPLIDESPSGAPFESYALDAGFTFSSGSEWTGADLHLTAEDTADYSTLQELRFYVKVVSGSAGDLILKLGETGERTDFDDDGFASEYDEALVATEVIDSAEFNSGSWEQVTWTLTASERQRLSKTRSLRFIFSQTDGTISTDTRNPSYDSWANGSYQVLIGGLELVGQTFSLSLEDDGNDSASVSMSEMTDSSLEAAYGDEIEQFHEDGSDQRVTRFTWSGIDNNDYWQAVSWLDTKDLTQFKKIIFFVENDSTPGSFSLDLTDLEEEGVHLSWDTDGTQTDWQKVTIDLDSRSAEFSGGAQNVNLSIDRGVTDLNRVVFTGADAASGTMKVDEIYFEESVVALSGKTALDLEYEKKEILTGAGGFQWMGNYFLDLYTTASLTGRTGGLADEEGSLAFQGQTGMDIMYLGVALQADGTKDNSGFTLWGGHDLTFPTFESPVVVEEAFALGDDSETPLLSHSASVNLFLPGSVKGTGTHEAVQEQEELAQEWSGALSRSSEKWQLSLKGDWASVSDEETRHEEGYFTVWGDSWSYVAPDETDVTDRSAKVVLKGNYEGEAVSPELSLTQGTNLGYSSEWKQTSSLTTALSLPISFAGEAGIVLTPAYGRTLSRTEEEDYSGQFGSDYAVWGEHILPLLPLTHFFPLWELADDEKVMEVLPTTGSYTYTPRFSLSMGRDYGSRIGDLFLPSFAEASFSRLYKGETDTRYYRNTWDFTVQQRALNLFGTFGVNRRFDFYATEEIANSFNLSLSSKNTAVPAGEDFSWNSYNRFEGESGNSLVMENDLTWEIADESLTEQLSTEYLWRTGRKPYRTIPLSKYIISTESYVQNSENLAYAYTIDSDDDYSYEIDAMHESVLHIEDLGTLAGWFKVGVNWNDERTKCGTELGVELTLTF